MDGRKTAALQCSVYVVLTATKIDNIQVQYSRLY